LTAVVLSYNGRKLLEVILPSLAAQRYGEFSTVVVDNGSTDDTVRWLAATWPRVRVVALPHNIGVTAALNVCLDAASCELVALFNNDIELDPNCLGELVRALDEHPDAGSAATKLLDFHDREVIDGAGDVYSWTGEASRRGHGTHDDGRYEEPRAIFGACGGAVLYRRSALAAVGGFDDQFFAVYEDVDWSFRAQLAGFACRYVPSAIAYHMGGATLGTEPGEFSLYHAWRNSIWVVAKNYPPLDLFVHAPALLRAQLRNLGIAVHSRRKALWLRVWLDVFAGLPRALAKRPQIQRSRRIGRRELRAIIGDNH
jgi:GT2 family glycosyltransferase